MSYLHAIEIKSFVPRLDDSCMGVWFGSAEVRRGGSREPRHQPPPDLNILSSIVAYLFDFRIDYCADT